MGGPRILAISLGTTRIGIAILKHGKFIEWRVKSFRQSGTPGKQETMLAAINRLITHHGITHLALKLPPSVKDIPALCKLTTALGAIALEKRIAFYTLTIADLKNAWLRQRKQSKNLLIEEVANRYSFLQPEYKREKKCKCRYYEKLFEAVATADTLYRDL